MKYFPLIGRILFVSPIVLFGFGHFANAEAMSGMVPSFLPAPMLIVYATGVLLVLGGIGVAAGYKVKESSLALAAFLLSTALLVWAPQLSTGGDMALPMMMRDLGLAGAAFLLAYFGPGPVSVEGQKEA